MNKEFVPYEQALALKELGFDEPCFGYYHICNTDELKEIYECDYFFHEKSGNFNSNCLLLKAPLYQQAFRWFREKYNLVIQYIPHEMDDEDGQSNLHHKYKISEYDSWRGGRRNTVETELNEDFEEAELECLKKLIEIVK
jgi:hypothetical protein